MLAACCVTRGGGGGGRRGRRRRTRAPSSAARALCDRCPAATRHVPAARYRSPARDAPREPSAVPPLSSPKPPPPAMAATKTEYHYGKYNQLAPPAAAAATAQRCLDMFTSGSNWISNWKWEYLLLFR